MHTKYFLLIEEQFLLIAINQHKCIRRIKKKTSNQDKLSESFYDKEILSTHKKSNNM